MSAAMKEETMQERLPLSDLGVTIWPLALATAAIVGSLAAACMFPFVAVATLAAATMSRRDALLTVAGAWAVNQLIGYTLMGYPQTGYSVGWGMAIGIASLAAALAAAVVLGMPNRLTATRLAAGFIAGFATYELLLFGYAHGAGGLDTFSADIVGMIALNDGLWFVGLLGLRLMLSTVAPRLFGPRPALRLA